MAIDVALVAALTTPALAGCAGLGGLIAHRKRRPPAEGMALGLLLGPIGVAVAARMPTARRLPVDPAVALSLRSVANFRASTFTGSGIPFERRR